jgi:hypothetical protein
MTTRRVGRTSLALEPAEIAQFAELGLDWPLGRWTIDDAVRATLLLRSADTLEERDFSTLLAACYRQGDNRERQAVLRALPLLRGADLFLPLAIDACRSHIQPLFEAIACENPYPARYFPDLNWNQLVLKALFIGVPLERLWALPERVTPELIRMADDYVSERRAAGRSLPDVARLTQTERTER